MRTALHHYLACSFDELRGAQSCRRDREDAVGIPLHHQRGDIDARQVLAEVFVPGSDAGQAGGGRGARRDVPTGLNRLFADTLSQELIGVVEILEEGAEECIAVGGYGLFDRLLPWRSRPG
jgi:hypothetical protein